MKDTQEEIALPRKVALYKSLDSDYYMISEVQFSKLDEHYNVLPEGEERERVVRGYVRITAPVEVSFTSLDNDSVIQKAVETLDEMERDAIRELNQKIASIREQKSQLLALTHQVEA